MNHRIGARIRALFVFQALFFCAVFTGFVLSYAFVVEDNIFNLQLDSEAAYIHEQYQQQGVLTEPRSSFMRLYRSWGDLPDAVYQLHLREPQRVEFSLPGDEVIHVKVLNLAPHAQFVLVAYVRPFEFANRTWPAMLKLLALLSAVLIILTSGLAYWRIKLTLAPLDRLTRQLQQPLAGDLPPSFAAGYPNNEIGFLASVIEQQWQQLQSSLARERDFTRDASHELRTPLTVLWNLHQQLVQEPTIDPVQVSQFGDMLAKQQQTIDVLLALARAEILGREPIRLIAAVEQSILMHPMMASVEDGALDVDIDPQCWVACNARLLDLLLANLLDNALKYGCGFALSIRLVGCCLYYANARTGSEPSLGIGQGLKLARRICAVHEWGLHIDERHDDQFVVAVSFDGPSSPCDGQSALA
jgi:signal transduction histidine kinase